MFMAKKRIKSYNAVEEKVKKEFFMNEKLKCHCMIHKPYPEIKPAKKRSCFCIASVGSLCGKRRGDIVDSFIFIRKHRA